ncbi:kleisin alpha [Kluyveromyces lactis]|uniref:KLLA0F14795p n=1 Tax=Kluyveromyces lactis (strain ATCC 8585 / CBS 2359 / DSM 70799 / NBRC 1267 / NRRL Y-1140 / WM37) TaxID=284590 RepID=Q6CJZ4_KLULA|nr:uncharacterized protein KLLA0_F14795g [Kluyveromyces lactis]CAG98453.1 KLLA0F14795p [Kluyveromyces lactis]|eukprot:XP_455745.1 uncharacterized protein KLLA0_F14795g [Kluyveromyces lactis]
MPPNSNSHTQVRLNTSNGPLAQIWLASNLSSINRNIAKTNIVESVEEIAKAAGVNLDDESVEPITLRASGELLHGVVKVYSQKASYLLTDITDLLSKVKSIFKGSLNKSVTIQLDTVAKLDQLLLQDAVTELDVLEMPSLDFLKDIQVPEGFLIAERSMERQVQGAAPVTSAIAAQQQAWDMSLEVGRRFLADEDDDLNAIEHHDSSHLKLDFDLGDSNQSNNTKSWGEGTRVTASEVNADDGENEGDLTIRNDNDDDDELLPLNDDWDLGLNDDDQNISGNQSSHGSDMSVEIGRRADITHSLHDDTLLDFDLGLPKDTEPEHQEQAEAYIPPRAVKKRAPRNKAFINVKKVLIDADAELNDSEVKGGPSDSILIVSDETSSAISKKKRAIDELYSDLDFLPQKIISNFFNHKASKKPRALSQSSQSDGSDVDIDISLGIDGSLVHNSDPFDHQQMGFDAESEGPVFADDEPPVLAADTSMEENDYQAIQSDEFASRGSIEKEKSQKVELATGEIVSKSTVEMATLLRDEMSSGEATFDKILTSKYQDNAVITKRMASKAFFELLSLATADCISLKQKETFGQITILGKSNLYETFVTA